MDLIQSDPLLSALFGVGLMAAALWSGWQSVNAKREARSAAKAAAPVSNGWGTKVTADMSRLVEGLDRLEARQDVQDRRQTAADERDTDRDRKLDKAISYARTAAEQSATVSAGLAAHLADHASEQSALHVEVTNH